VFEKNSAPAGKFGSLRRVLRHNRSLYRDLNNFLEEENSYDLIIATTPRLDHLLAHELLHWRFRKRQQRWALIFIEAIGKYSPDYSQIQFSKKSLLLKLALKFSRWLPKREQFSLFVEAEGIARQYEKFCGVKFGLVPHVTRLPALDGWRDQKNFTTGQPLTFATYGFTRYDKGLDILQSALRQIPESTDKFFVLQWTGDYSLPDGSWVRKDAVLEKSPMIRYIPAFTASDDYYAWLARTDIMVLPYRRDFYYDRLSRVAIDAALAGVPIVYPAGTWLEGFVEKHAAGVAFEPENPSSLAKAIEEAQAKYVELKVRAESRKAATANAFSAKTFFDLIAASFAGKTTGA
jgi:glycosyltransferase involved in cell wall biosynthesis